MGISIIGVLGLALLVAIVTGVSHLGGYPLPGMVDFFIAFMGLSGMVAILKHPWDLYFDARNLRLEQEESLRKSINIPEEDIEYTRRLVPRLLLTCLGCHILAAGAAFAAAWFSNGVVGYWFAGFFLLSTVFRPIHAFHVHMKTRLYNLKSRCFVPREDSVELASRLGVLEQTLTQLRKDIEEETKQNLKRFEKAEHNFEALRGATTTEIRRFNDRVSTVCDEFQKSIERLTEDQELLRGIKAFVHMVKNTP